VDRNRLKPSKISVPHSLNTSENLSICIISADPQRGLKNIVADPTFPTHLSSRISRVIGLTKLKAKYKTFETRRELLNEHDVFLADDRIISRLPALLGKIFYKGTSKRPVPVRIAAAVEKSDKKVANVGKSRNSSQEQKQSLFAKPAVIAKEIEKAIDAVPVSLRPGTSVAVRVGLATFSDEELVDNIAAVTNALIEKHVVKGWRNVKAIHVKSPTSTAIPIWQADDLWVGNENVADSNADANSARDIADGADTHAGGKRKRSANTTKGPQAGERKRVKAEEAQAGSKEKTKKQASARKEKLAALKASAFGGDSITVG